MASFSSYVVAHPSIYLAAAPVIALTALSTTPSFLPMVILIVILRLHVYTFLPRGKAASHGLPQVLLLSLAASITHVAASMHALSTGATLSIIVLGGLSALSAAVSLATISLGYYISRMVHTPWAKLTLFPAIWASIWGTVEHLSPVGRLITWSPVVGLGPYSWIRPIWGQWGIDWVVAAWAVAGADLIGSWLVGSASNDLEDTSSQQQHIISFAPEDLQEHVPTPKSPSQSSSQSSYTHLLIGLLIALIVPSFFTPSLPLPVIPSLGTTAITVGCALPDMRRSGVLTGTPTLKDFMATSHELDSMADIIIWPEGAVRFESTAEKEAMFRQISTSMPGKKLYGISFEELTLRDLNNGTQKESMRRNGFSLIGRQGTVFEYYKRNLVPIAESFSLTPSFDPPSIYTMEIEAPKDWNKTAWAPLGKHTRPISLTASICLDFSTSSTFEGLESRPALILAPARTWHIDVGYAMWEQARARAEELGSVVVWCDGGAGGVSGVAGRGMHEVMQVGQGSWTRRISVEWPFDQSRTLFSRGGGFAALATVWGIVGVGSVVEVLLGLQGNDMRGRVVACFNSMVSRLRFRKKTDGERPLLD